VPVRLAALANARRTDSLPLVGVAAGLFVVLSGVAVYVASRLASASEAGKTAAPSEAKSDIGRR